jgi:hypothetical protein
MENKEILTRILANQICIMRALATVLQADKVPQDLILEMVLQLMIDKQASLEMFRVLKKELQQ